MSDTRQVISPEGSIKTPLLSPAILHNGTLYVSGSVGMNFTTMKMVEGSCSKRTRQALANIETVLRGAGSDLTKLLKVNIYLTNMEDYAAMNKAYMEVIPEPRPARTCVCVAELPFKTDVEIECIAHL